MVQSIVKEVNGTINVESKNNHGTADKILFPAINEKKSPSQELPGDVPNGKKHVLFVDDEIFITTLGRRSLEHYGYKVTTVNSSMDALDIFSKDPDDFDVVVTDLTMPDMKGDRLIAQIQHIKAGAPCILCTGYNKEITQTWESIKGVTAVLNKPIGPNELASAVQHLLNKEAATDTAC